MNIDIRGDGGSPTLTTSRVTLYFADTGISKCYEMKTIVGLGGSAGVQVTVAAAWRRDMHAAEARAIPAHSLRVAVETLGKETLYQTLTSKTIILVHRFAIFG